MGNHKIGFLAGRGRKWVAFTCAVHPAVRLEQWYTMSVECHFSPSPACGCLYLSVCQAAPYTLYHESYSVQWLPQLGLTCGCRHASVCKENHGRMYLQQLIPPVRGVHQQDQVGGRFLGSTPYPMLLPWYPCCAGSLGLW